MSEFPWPHPTHAEDQPYAKSLLYIHVFHRGFEAGGLIGSLYGSYKLYRHNQQIQKPSLAPAPAPASASASASSSALIKNTGMRTIFYPTVARSSLIGAGATMLLLTGRMRGTEDVEWQDRSWRLLENEGQVMHDLYADVGAAVGAAAGVASVVANRLPVSVMVREVVGRAGLGAVVGFVGCEVVRGYRLFTAKGGDNA
ncbi:uncharacterized protein BHQ10_003249 [Talaromyces amestolkiae]|uniref:Uncharacterized protein n=1 Tax=Talaromyces amestolkiae TaxID=1196081 RepID=A0A364KUK4_TALAM|nr:uncharacterized protein BHQ10_003249 [Talaromyces amestolkiae]RAO67237.1 hypothetical protein BHQ10_003249 [Talaromyces amestolkiae]